jgi:hypothetical protein
MPHIEVKAPAIQQESPIPRRLLIVAVVLVEHTHAQLFEKVILHPCRPRLGVRPATGDEAPVFRLDASNPVHSQIPSEEWMRKVPAHFKDARRWQSAAARTAR